MCALCIYNASSDILARMLHMLQVNRKIGVSTFLSIALESEV